MDINSIAGKLGLAGSKQVIRKAEELRRQADVQFDSSVIGIVGTLSRFRSPLCPSSKSASILTYPWLSFSLFQGEVCKAIICLEIAATR